MRKFTLFLLAVCFALTAGAAPKGPRKDVKLPAAVMQRLQQRTGAQVIYVLRGRRVVTPQKGLYILNGRKMVK